jgi:glycosyltransferase involved in cell wall biosynthesis
LLIDKNLRYQMKENGLARANCFTWKKTALKTIQVYESVASAKPI